MRKLVNGIVEFRRKVQPGYKETFARLALGQSPDTLMIACSDSRVVPNLFASTEPGDLFVVRNIGNLVPPCGVEGISTATESEAAAIEFSLLGLKVSDIIVCGHSECGAMSALVGGRENITSPNLRAWLRHGETSMARLGAETGELTKPNQLSQQNVLQQLENLRSYPVVRERLDAGQLRLHAWWFELRSADVYSYEETLNRFVLIDENEAAKILSKLS